MQKPKKKKNDPTCAIVRTLFLLIFIFLRVREKIVAYTPRFCTVIILDLRK